MNQYPNGPQQPNPYPTQQPGGQYPSNPGYPPAQPGPYTQYPPNGQPGYPPPYQQPPMQQPQAQEKPKKKKNKVVPIGCGIVAVVVLIAIISAATHSGGSAPAAPASSGGSSNTTTTSAPAAPQTWTTTHTYSGSGEKKTDTITVPDDWKIEWTCDPTSFDGMNYNVIIAVYNSDGTIADPGAINDMCKSGNTSGETEERTAGNVYLDVTSEGTWNITIQELK